VIRLQDVAMAVGGELRGPDRAIDGVSTDSRTLVAGQLFFALKGEHFDAARFLDSAFEHDAAGAVVTLDAVSQAPGERSLIVVDNVRAALGRFAANWRQRFSLPVIGLTGSNGKTTVKEMVSTLLSSVCGDAKHVLATEGNLNNDVGMPLTLLRLRDHHRYAVIEMGMNHAGEIRYLTHIARPRIALITNAGSAHVGLLGSVAAIAAAKGEIFEGLSDDGIAVINADDAHAQVWRGLNPKRRVITFGLGREAEVTGQYRGHKLTSEIVLQTPRGKAGFVLSVPGVHNVRNALAAAAVGVALDLAPETIAHGLTGFAGYEGRLQPRAGRRGSTLIDDTYNANPDSARAAIAVLAEHAGKRVLVLGDMGELGDQAEMLHAAVGAAARAAGIERLFTLGTLTRAAAAAFGSQARHYTRAEDLIAALESELGPEVTVLIKGSRFMQMERVVESIAVDEK
jgi:UDP-N-acetylmuramoyl-tripeptide--D-alanyl-D-alanine ligase